MPTTKQYRFNEYQKKAEKTNLMDLTTREALYYFALGLAGEGGEVANKIKKYIRGDYEFSQLRKLVLDELGDVLWYIAMLAKWFDIPLEDIASYNIEKLRSRMERGVIQGDGDKR